ncbi:hypothetical protein [Thauera sp.]|uniref:hypothetical protein n=1 Tax=Thauera sp. TaxID=1905334 RepID=UPI002C450C9D|nr:hypothetical protein [Thauera sp.]HRP25961.1 hypothetical protein [Thauera sp.]
MNYELKTDTKNDEIIGRSVSLYGRNWAVVDEINTRFDFGNVSIALRYIINEYQRLTTEK